MIYLLLFVFLGPTIVCEESDIKPRSCNKVKCETTDDNGVTMRYLSGHTIDNHTIIRRTHLLEIEGHEQRCVKKCISVPACITVVVNETACRLYGGDDVYDDPRTIVPMLNSKIISLGNGACKYQPCGTNGKCVPEYEKGTFTCVCDKGYNCEISCIRFYKKMKIHVQGWGRVIGRRNDVMSPFLWFYA